MLFFQNHKIDWTSPRQLFLAHVQNRPVRLDTWLTVAGHMIMSIVGVLFTPCEHTTSRMKTCLVLTMTAFYTCVQMKSDLIKQTSLS